MKYIEEKVVQKIKNVSIPFKNRANTINRGVHPSTNRGSNLEYREYREYSPGDEPKFIDWKVYARTGKLFVKEFEADVQLPFLVFLDTSRSITDFKGPEPKFELAKYITATLCYLLLSQQDRVSLYFFSDSLIPIFQHANKPSFILAAEKKIEKIKPGNTTDFTQLKKANPKTVTPPYIYIISDFLADQEQIFSSIAHFQSAGAKIIMFHLISSWEIEFPFSTEVLFEEPESGKTLALNAHGVAESYQKLIAEHRESLKQKALSKQIEYFPFPLTKHYSDSLIDYIRTVHKKEGF